MNIKYCDCVTVALGIHHALRMCHIAICCPVPLYNIFPHYLIKSTILGIKLLNTKCVLIFCTILSATFLTLTTIKPRIIINAHSCSGKVANIIGQILMEIGNSGQIFEKKTQYEI